MRPDITQWAALTPTTALDYPDLVFLGWEGNVTSSARTISGTLNSSSFTLEAVYAARTSDGGGGPEGGGVIEPGGDPGGPGTQLECIPGVDPHCGITSPIVINFDNGPYRLTGTESAVLFDITGSGSRIPISWTAAGTNQSFLWIDRNHDGAVTGGAELFGTATMLSSGQRAANGFEALRDFDANGDGVIDANDQVWHRLMLWTDLNHNAISEPNEVTHVADSALRAISLKYHWTGKRDSHGNTFQYEGLISIANGGNGTRQQPVYDIFFVLLFGGNVP